jgi:uncharacterized protein YjdB
MKKIYLIILALTLCYASFAQPVISGPLQVCATYQVTLTSTSPGCVWSSSNPTIASIGSSSGIVTGVSGGVCTITYNCGSSGFSTVSFTVNPLPATIPCPTPGCNVCLGSTITILGGPPGGVWSTQIPAFATVGPSSGVVTGVSLGTTVISYALVPTGCFVTSLINVVPNPGPISGTNVICVGQATTLNCTPPAGVAPGIWSSGCTGVTVGSSSGVVVGVNAGVCSITYTIGNGCYSTYNVTVNPTPGPISCPSTSGCAVCVGNNLLLTDPTPGGVWASSNPAIGSINPVTGVLTGISPGVVTITYTLPGGCFVSVNVVVNPNPSSITGVLTICVGQTTSLTATAPPGTIGVWSSSNPGVGTISTTGVVNGLAAGVTTITFSIPGSGCFSVVNVTVNPTPGPIACPSTSGCAVCVGNSITLTDPTPGGVWSSSNPAIATINSVTGVLTGVSPGAVTITYTLPGGCSVTVTIIVNPNPAPITGTLTVCVGSTTGLNCITPGGIWSSSNNAVGTISTSGVVTGISAGVTTITYALSTGCFSVVNVTVNPTPIILGLTGGVHVCVGQTIGLTANPTGGVWSSGNPGIATVGPATGIVTGITPGVTTITYTLGTGCFATILVTVTPNPGPITGVTSICIGGSTTLSCPPTGGIWSSACSGITVGSTSGVVVGVAAGVCTVTYTLPTGCFATINITVNPLPTITGTPYTCVSATTTLTGSPGGGIWVSANPGVATVGAGSGVVTGVTPGTAAITYTISTGCSVTIIVTVTPAPGPIYCPSLGCMVCQGNSVLLTNPIPGGQWSSSNTGIATVGSNTGVVTGVSVGTSYITYTLGGCFVTTLFTVNPLPIAYTVTGGGSYCAGGIGVLVGLSNSQLGVNYQLFCGLSPVGAPVAGTGSAISFGYQTGPCTYTVVATNAFGCSTTMIGNAIVTVNPTPLPIVCPVGTCSVCAGTSMLLTDPTPGGVWSSSNPAIGTIGSSSGIVTGITTGVTIITYTLPGGCYVTTPVTVNPAPVGITGPTTLCTGSSITLSDATPGGVWTSGCANANVNSSSGIVTGVGAGPCTITYTLPGGCYATYSITVNQTPGPISGPTSVCVGVIITLTDPTPGGLWSSGCVNASVGSTSGVVSGIAAGPCTITYTMPGGCYVTYAITVNPVPCVTLGVSGTSAEAGRVEVFPNPAYDELTVKIKEGTYSSFTITNNLGQVLIEQPLAGKEKTIDIKSLSAAVYYITLRGESGIAVKRFIKQ